MNTQPPITVCEAFFRDGLQGWPEVISTTDKLRLIEAVVAAGVSEIDVASFVPPRVSPQFSDAAQMIAAVPERVRVRVLVPNLRGVERALTVHESVRRIDRVGVPYSASEAHNQANLGRDHATHRLEIEGMQRALAGTGTKLLLGVATAFGCPIKGAVAPEEVLDVVHWAAGLGITDIMFGDTTGMADPRSVGELLAEAVERWPEVEFVAHFHDNRGAGLANVLAAIKAGVRTVDASLGGIGGEPSSVDQGDVGESGNVTTEDLVATLHQMGIQTGIDTAQVLAAGRLAEETLGRPLHSRVQRAGVVGFIPERN